MLILVLMLMRCLRNSGFDRRDMAEVALGMRDVMSQEKEPSLGDQGYKICEGIDTLYFSSRKMRVLAHFTIHMVEIIQLYTNQPRMWLGFRHHPSSSVFQPYVWLGTISNSWNNTK